MSEDRIAAQIDDHRLRPKHTPLPLHMSHPIAGEEVLAGRWEGDPGHYAKLAKKS